MLNENIEREKSAPNYTGWDFCNFEYFNTEKVIYSFDSFLYLDFWSNHKKFSFFFSSFQFFSHEKDYSYQH